MRRSFLIAFSMLALCIGSLCFTRTASARASGVVDNSGMFSAAAVSQADQIIQQIESRHHKDVRIEAYPSIPPNLQPQFQSLGKDRFFDTWVDDIGKREQVNGIIILICKDPGRVQIAVGNDTRRQAFTNSDRDAVREQFLGAFRSQDYDTGLLQAVQSIQQRMDANMAGASSAGSPGTAGGGSTAPPRSLPPAIPSTGFPIGGFLCVGVVILVVVLVIFGMASRNRGGGYGGPGYGGGNYPPGYQGGPGYGGGGYGGGGGGGGGFGRGLMGGLLGGALGAWGYDKFSGRGGQGGAGTPTPGGTDASTGGDFSGGGADTSYSSSGGDFDSSSSSSGGDFGGSSDSGGGGGGDFGGGGGGGDSGGSSSGGDF